MNLFKKYILSCILFISAITADAQQSKVDSLLTVISNEEEDTIKAGHLADLVRLCELTGKYSDGLFYGNQALELSTRLNYKKGIAITCNNVGNIYLTQSNFPKALEYYLRTLTILESIGNKNISACLGNIGLVNMNMGNFDKALEYYFRALKLDEKNDFKPGIAVNSCNIGMVYWKQKKFPEAMAAYLKALKTDEELGDRNGMAIDLSNMANIYYDQSKASVIPSERDSLEAKALSGYLKALNVFEELGDKNGLTTVLGNIGPIYFDKGEYKKAEEYLLRGLMEAKKSGILGNQVTINRTLSELYQKTGEPKKAYEHYKAYSMVKDSIFNEEKNNEFTRNEMNYEFDKKAAQLKAEQDKKEAVSAAEKKKQRIVFWLICLVAIAITVIAIVVFRSLRITRKQKEIIESQKDIVEEKQKEILDSIHYARRIQSSLLPSETYMRKSLERLRKK
jgi:tetratricopeptide (TPR) repeat protein